MASRKTPDKKTAAKPKKAADPSKKKAEAAPAKGSRGDDLKRTLLSKREEILAETKHKLAEYREGGGSRQEVETALDEGDWSLIEHSDSLNLRKLRSYRDILIKIDEALRKLDEKTYGVCEDCGKNINPERLKILPFAICCRDCQEMREQEESARSEDYLAI